MRSCSENSSAGHTSEPIYGNFVLSWSGPTLNFHCVELERALCIPRLVNKYALFLGEDVVLLIPVNSLWHKRIVVWLTVEKSDIPLFLCTRLIFLCPPRLHSSGRYSFRPSNLPEMMGNLHRARHRSFSLAKRCCRSWRGLGLKMHTMAPSSSCFLRWWRCTGWRRCPRALSADEEAWFPLFSHYDWSSRFSIWLKICYLSCPCAAAWLIRYCIIPG